MFNNNVNEIYNGTSLIPQHVKNKLVAIISTLYKPVTDFFFFFLILLKHPSAV